MNLTQQIQDIDPNFLYRTDDTFHSLCGAGTGSGWHPIILDALKKIKRKCDEEGVDLPKVDQIKEKFGGLRMYFSCHYDFMDDIINDVTEKADKTCEITGKKGSLHVFRGWYRTVSDEVAKKEKLEKV